MKLQALVLLLMTLATSFSAMAHDVSSVCEGICEYQTGHGKARILLSVTAANEPTAGVTIRNQCEALHGRLLPDLISGDAGYSCRTVWH